MNRVILIEASETYIRILLKNIYMMQKCLCDYMNEGRTKLHKYVNHRTCIYIVVYIHSCCIANTTTTLHSKITSQ